MTPEQARRFQQLILMGRIRIDIAESLRGLIEDVRDTSFAAGERASATPFDVWPIPHRIEERP